MCRLGGYLGHSGIILEPSGVIRDALTHRGESGPNHGEGVGKGVNPFNEGKESSLNHLRPEGWWDSHFGERVGLHASEKACLIEVFFIAGPPSHLQG